MRIFITKLCIGVGKRGVPMEFKERLKILRKAKNKTQGDIAQVLNYGYTAISNYESGRNEPSIADLKKIAQYFDVSMDYLLCVNDIKNPYLPADENIPGEDFIQKYSALPDESKKQLESMLDWLAAQNSVIHKIQPKEYKAAQKKSAYKTKNNK